MIAMFGHPSPLAREDNAEPGQERDEDNLGRERFDHDRPTDTLELIYERLKHGDEAAAHSAMAIARFIPLAIRIS